ncbi:MAG: glycosyltransferase family 2 protein [Thermodesulfobacteriota bacterium]
MKRDGTSKIRHNPILIIIPAYNEAESIGHVITAIRGESIGADVVVINDGSTDDTAAIVKKMGTTVISHPCNMGIGATMQTGYRFAADRGYRIAVQVDADGQHSPEEIVELVEPLKRERADIVIGSRFIGKGAYKAPVPRRLGMLIFSAIISAIVGKKLTDTTSGFRAVNDKVINFYVGHYPEDYPEVEVLILLHKAGFRITELPVVMNVRMGGTSSITPIRAGYYMVKVLLAVFIDLMKHVER